MKSGSGRRTSLLLRASLCIILLAAPLACLDAESTAAVFNWAFVKRAPNGSPVPIVFSERVAIAAGDLFKIYIQPIENTFIYLFLHDAEGSLQLLFPDRFEQFSGTSYDQKQFFLPEGENWFTLDSAKGVERFYLLASDKRLARLESLSAAYRKAAADGASAPGIETARQAVLDEIASLRAQHSQLTMAAEKPVTIAGGTRGINASVEKLATRIEAPGFYYKLFRLQH